MSLVGDLVQGAVDSALKEILRKTTGTGKRARRRKRTTSQSRSRTTISSRTLRELEKLLRPARKQVSRRKTTGTRSQTQKRRVAAKTRSHRRSLRRGAATR
jgi:rRNA-processing protein FCF1